MLAQRTDLGSGALGGEVTLRLALGSTFQALKADRCSRGGKAAAMRTSPFSLICVSVGVP